MRPDQTPTQFLHAFAFAIEGIRSMCTERNFRIQLLFAAAAIILGLTLSISPAEWLAVALCIGMVLAAESFNSALEDTIDLACPHLDPVAKHAKDVAAGAVLICSITALIIGIAIFAPKLWVVLLP